MIRTILAALALLLGPAGARGQMASAGPAGPVPALADVLARADSLYAALDPLGSLEAIEAVAGTSPASVAAAWRAARACVAIGMVVGGREDEAWYLRGEALGASAVAADSADLDALFWLTAAKGRLALEADAGDAARLGDEVWRLAHRILELAPDHAGAHNVLGRLQYEVMTLSRVERFLARMLLGDNEALRSSSWDGAETHQLRAVTLDPDGILYRYDLARLYLRRDRPVEAEAELHVALTLAPRYPPDPSIQEDARRLLRRIEEDR